MAGGVTSVAVTGSGVSDVLREVCRVLETAGLKVAALHPQRVKEFEGEVLAEGTPAEVSVRREVLEVYFGV
jgi:ABC-type branched-subunit amino acid transport system ATPase component